MNRELQLIRAVAVEADGLYEEAKKLGAAAAKCFPATDGRAGRSQMTALETLANSSLKVSDVLDYIKKQTAKAEKQHTWQKDSFGKSLLAALEETLGSSTANLKVSPPVGAGAEKQHVHLMLIREFVRQLSAHYEYARSTSASGGQP